MIYNFGSLNIDYVYKVANIARDGETISSNNLMVFAGGKGLNQSIAISRAGGSVCHCGYVSESALFLRDELQNCGVDISLLKVVDNVNGHAVIQVDSRGNNSILLYGGTNQLLDSEFVSNVHEKIEKNDIILFQNETSAVEEMMYAASNKGTYIVLNPSPVNKQCLNLPLSLVNLFILNEIEGKAITGKNNAEEIIDALTKRFPNAEILLTLGENGCIYSGNEEKFSLPSFKIGKPVDTTAAGDTFTGYFLSLLESGQTALDSARIATKASGISIMRNGAASSIPMIDELNNY